MNPRVLAVVLIFLLIGGGGLIYFLASDDGTEGVPPATDTAADTTDTTDATEATDTPAAGAEATDTADAGALEDTTLQSGTVPDGMAERPPEASERFDDDRGASQDYEDTTTRRRAKRRRPRASADDYDAGYGDDYREAKSAATDFDEDEPFPEVDGETTLVILSRRSKDVPQLGKQVRRLVKRPIEDLVNVVPTRDFNEAVRKLPSKRKKARKNVAKAGEDVGATHVLVVTGRDKKPGAKKKKHVRVVLVDVGTGQVAYAEEYPLRGQKLTPKVAKKIALDVLSAMPRPGSAGTLASADVTVEEGDPTADEAATDNGEPEADDGSETTEAADEEETKVATLDEEDTPVITIEEPLGWQPSPWRQPIEFGVGGIAIQRSAALSAEGERQPSSFGGPLLGGHARFAVYPLAFNGNGDWIEGFGLHAEGVFMHVKTVVRGEDAETRSNVMGFNGGASYRIALSEGTNAPHLVVNLGYGMLIFPLNDVFFPGAQYSGPYAGGSFTMPLLDDHLAVVVGGNFSAPLSVSGTLQELSAGGELQGFPMSFRTEGGVRVRLGPVEVLALGRFEQFNAGFSGESTFPEWRAQFQNVDLTDRMFGGVVTVGTGF